MYSYRIFVQSIRTKYTLELVLINGCKKRKSLKNLDILKIMINLKSIFYVVKEMSDSMIEFFVRKKKSNNLI